MWSYVETSAAVKLALDETHSDAMREWISTTDDITTSRLTSAELVRGVRRHGPDPVPDDIMLRWLMIDIDEHLLRRAGLLEPRTLRTLDAIHLATAERLAPELEAFVTYDARLAEAAASLGLRVVSPGA